MILWVNSLAFAFFLTSWLYLLLLCLSRQLSHLVCPGIALLAQLRHWPFAFLSCRTFFPWTLAASFRSAVWFLACSYKRRASRCSSGVLLGLGAFLDFSFLRFGFLTFLSFFLGSALANSKKWWKVLSSVRGWGAKRVCVGVRLGHPRPGAAHGCVCAVASGRFRVRTPGRGCVRTVGRRYAVAPVREPGRRRWKQVLRWGN